MQYPTRLAFSATFASLLAGACTDATLDEPGLDLPSVPVRDVQPGDEPAPSPTPDPARCIPDETGAAMYGTSNDDEFRDVVVTSDGSIVIAGFENGTASSAGTTGSRGIAVRYAVTFTRLATLDTLGTASFDSIALDPADARVWLAARTNVDVAAFPSQGGYDYLIGDLQAGGFHPMARGHDSTPEYAKQLAVGNGLVAIAGHEERLVSDGSTWINPFLATFTSNDMAPQWFTTRRHADTERYTAVDVSSQAVVVGGSIADGAQPGMFVTARSHDADVLWTLRISDVGTDELAAVRVLPDGDVLWAGTTSAVLGANGYGGTDIVIGRIDSSTGAGLWTTQLGTDADEHVVDIALDSAGNIYIAGDTTTEATDRDVFLLVTDDAGNLMSMQEWASPGDDAPAAVAVDSCGTAVLVGSTTGDFVGNGHGGRDGFVLVSR